MGFVSPTQYVAPANSFLEVILCHTTLLFVRAEWCHSTGPRPLSKDLDPSKNIVRTARWTIFICAIEFT